MHAVERFAEMQQQQIAFVANVGIEGGAGSHRSDHGARLFENTIAMKRFLLAPVRAAETKHLMKGVRAFEGERNRRKLSHVAAPILLPAKWACHARSGPGKFRRRAPASPNESAHCRRADSGRTSRAARLSCRRLCRPPLRRAACRPPCPKDSIRTPKNLRGVRRRCTQDPGPPSRLGEFHV